MFFRFPHTPVAALVLALLGTGCSNDDGNPLPDDDVDGAAPVASTDPSSDMPGDAGSILSLTTRDVVLADVLRAINATALETAFVAGPPLTGADDGVPAGITLLAVTDGVTDGAPQLPASPTRDEPGTLRTPESYQRRDYQCDAGGTVSVFADTALLDGAPIRDDVAVYDGCSLDGNTFDGATRTNEVYVRPPSYGVSAAGFSITSEDGNVRRIDGSRVRGQTDRVTPSEYVALYDVGYTEIGDDRTVSVSDYTVRLDVFIDDIPAGEYTDALLPDGTIAEFFETTLRASLDGSFLVDAPWSGGEPATVTVELVGEDAYWRWAGWTPDASNEVFGELVGTDGASLSFDVEPDERFAWDGGRVTVTAADGSTLVLEPVDGSATGIDAAAFAITAGAESTIIPQEALPIACAERVRNGCVIGADD